MKRFDFFTSVPLSGVAGLPTSVWASLEVPGSNITTAVGLLLPLKVVSLKGIHVTERKQPTHRCAESLASINIFIVLWQSEL